MKQVREMRRIGLTFGIITSLFLWVMLSPQFSTSRTAHGTDEGAPQSTITTQQEIAVPPPPFSEDMFPCSECHGDLEVNRERRELEDFHDDIVLEHDEENRWCLAGILQALRPVPRPEAEGLESRHPRQEDRHVERAERVPLMCPLS
jgi:hypothetical protein